MDFLSAFENKPTVPTGNVAITPGQKLSFTIPNAPIVDHQTKTANSTLAVPTATTPNITPTSIIGKVLPGIPAIVESIREKNTAPYQKFLAESADKYNQPLIVDGKLNPKGVEAINELFMGFVNPVGGPSINFGEELARKQAQRDMLRELVDSHPGKSLAKFANKNGEIPEVLGQSAGKFKNRGDSIVTEFGFADSETARASYQDYLVGKKRLTQIEDEYKQLRQQVSAQSIKTTTKEPADDVIKRATEARKADLMNRGWIKEGSDPLLQEAKKYKSADEFVKAQFSKKPEYGMGHRPSWDGTPPAHNLLEGDMLPRDVYTHPDFSIASGAIRRGDKAANESWEALQKIRGNPEAEITIYRAGAKNELNVGDWITFSKEYAKQSVEGAEKVHSFKVKAKDALFAGDDINEFGYYPKSQLTDIWNKANSSELPKLKLDANGNPLAYTPREKAIVEAGQNQRLQTTQAIPEGNTPPSRLPDQSKVPESLLQRKPSSDQILLKKEIGQSSISSEELSSLQKTLEQTPLRGNQIVSGSDVSFKHIIEDFQTPVNKKINIIDQYLRTPEKVLVKIGLGKEVKYLRAQYEGYLKELPKNIDTITEWSKRVPKESNERIFKFLDGQNVKLNPEEKKVAGEIRTWLSDWATRLGLPEDNRIANYITHIFDDQLIRKEFDEDLAKIIADKIPSSVYDPFLQKRLGAMGYREDTWAALDAYAKRATRKVYMDPALEKISAKAESFEKSQWDYVKNFIDRVNLRPTDVDEKIDNTIKSIFGYKFGQRPVTNLSRSARQMVYRGGLGLNVGSALRNLTQGVNTYAELGERFTAKGYIDLLKNGTKELKEVGVLNDQLIQDRTLSSVKSTLQKADKGLFAMFDAVEKINRGSAYYGAKAKALKEGKTLEQAIEYGKEVVRKTQFNFGTIDTPAMLQSDIMKTLFQFQSFSIKQMEFLGEKVMNKEWAGLARYIGGSLAVLYTFGELFGMRPTDIIPSVRVGSAPVPKLANDIYRDVTTQKDKYGQPLTAGSVARQLGNDAVVFIPAGAQAKKTIQGIGAVRQGKDTTATGRTRFEIPQTTENYLRAGIFGKNNLPQADAYYEKLNAKSTPKTKVGEKDPLSAF